MRTTRSSTRQAGVKEEISLPVDEAKKPRARKRKVEEEPAAVPRKIARVSSPEADNAALAVSITEEPLVPAVLSFDFEAAKAHLIQADDRFEDLFNKLTCKPFEHLEAVHPFRALAVSILGQQISWLAARSITHKFIRLFKPDLPEKPTDEERRAITFFPSPQQVANADIAELRTAGLSARKAEYIKDLAQRFSDGRLSTGKLMQANDDDLSKMLVEVRGIGRWTVDMFAIFSMRRPDILPVGDLGVQRGLLRWALSRHSSEHPYSIAPEKIGNVSTSDTLPTLSSTPGANASATNETEEGIVALPPTFTPSINKTLNKPGKQGRNLPPLPAGLNVKEMASRLAGKKKIKGAFLTPQEMDTLTETWKPYRSLGVYYMWSLAG